MPNLNFSGRKKNDKIFEEVKKFHHQFPTDYGIIYFLHQTQNMHNIKKIQLVSHYYIASLADGLNFIQLKCHIVLVKRIHIFLGRNLHLPPSLRK